jgi:hypothetical protein
MGKHASNLNKAVFLTHLYYVYIAKAIYRAGLTKLTITDIKNASANI